MLAKAQAIQAGFDKSRLLFAQADDPVYEFMKKLQEGQRRRHQDRVRGNLRRIPPRSPKREIREP